ncbi:hypothetical protein [Pyrococcus sp. ST04]|nr:hypothetical protein [Pyrococcus sp. ST04]
MRIAELIKMPFTKVRWAMKSLTPPDGLAPPDEEAVPPGALFEGEKR